VCRSGACLTACVIGADDCAANYECFNNHSSGCYPANNGKCVLVNGAGPCTVGACECENDCNGGICGN